jgi:pimeloyl-ACP methyl ester carboxylesterase
VLDLLTRLLTLEWRRSGATLRRVDVLGSHVYYAEFAPARRGALPAALGRLPLVGGRFRRGSSPRRAPTVVLLHGLGASGASFFPVIGALRRGYRVVVPDLPGYGGSRPPAGRACGHCPQLECPRRTAEILLDLPKLRRIRPRAPAARRAPAVRARVARDGAAAS